MLTCSWEKTASRALSGSCGRPRSCKVHERTVIDLPRKHENTKQDHLAFRAFVVSWQIGILGDTEVIIFGGRMKPTGLTLLFACTFVATAAIAAAQTPRAGGPPPGWRVDVARPGGYALD